MKLCIYTFLAAVMLLLTGSAVLADGCYIPKLDTSDLTEPTQKAFIAHFDGKEQMVLQVSYKGDVSEFVWLVPTPSRPKVREDDGHAFYNLHRLTAPRIRYWLNADRIIYDLTFTGFAGGRGAKAVPESVDVLERKQVGVYDVSILQSASGDSLLDWLRTNGYHVKPEAKPVLNDYARRGWVFTAMRINTGENGPTDGQLQPIQFVFSSSEAVYPLKISSLNAGRTKILLYVLNEHRVAGAPLTTECVVDRHQARHLIYRMYETFPRQAESESLSYYVTKMTGDLDASQMKSDLILRQAPSDQMIPRGYASPGFLENVSAMAMMPVVFFLGLAFWPICFALCAFAVMAGSSMRPNFSYASLSVLTVFGFLGMAILLWEVTESFWSFVGWYYWPIAIALLITAAAAKRLNMKIIACCMLAVLVSPAMMLLPSPSWLLSSSFDKGFWPAGPISFLLFLAAIALPITWLRRHPRIEPSKNT